MGHEDGNMALDVYSGGLAIEPLRESINKLTYGSGMDLLIKKISKRYLIDPQVLPKDTSNKQLKRDVSLRRIGRNGSILRKLELLQENKELKKGNNLSKINTVS